MYTHTAVLLPFFENRLKWFQWLSKLHVLCDSIWSENNTNEESRTKTVYVARYNPINHARLAYDTLLSAALIFHELDMTMLCFKSFLELTQNTIKAIIITFTKHSCSASNVHILVSYSSGSIMASSQQVCSVECVCHRVRMWYVNVWPIARKLSCLALDYNQFRDIWRVSILTAPSEFLMCSICPFYTLP